MAMTFKGVPFIFLGAEPKKNKEDKEYMLLNLMDQGGSIIQFYISPSNHNVLAQISALEQMKPITADLEISSFQMKPQLNIIKVDKR